MNTQENHENNPGKSSPGNYEVGNKKPPMETRFPKGTSGNPNGRPKGSRNKKGEKHYHGIDDLVLEEAYREIEVTEEGQKIKMPMIQAAMRSQAIKAAKGDPRAFQHQFKNVSEIEHKKREEHYRFLEAVVEYKLTWKAEQKRCKALGLEMPDLELDPDDIFIDPETEEIFVLSPTKKQKQAIERLFNMKKDTEGEIEYYKQRLSDPDKLKTSEWYQDNLKKCEKHLARINGLIG